MTLTDWWIDFAWRVWALITVLPLLFVFMLAVLLVIKLLWWIIDFGD